MAVKIRLARAGAKKAPFYRVVAADARAPRDGRFIQILGRYNPRTQPSTVEIDLEKVDSWLAKGASPTESAAKLIAIARGEKSAPATVESVSKKARAKADAEAKASADTAAKAVAPEVTADAVVEDTPEASADETSLTDVPVEEAADASPADEAPTAEPDGDAAEAPAAEGE